MSWGFGIFGRGGRGGRGFSRGVNFGAGCGANSNLAGAAGAARGFGQKFAENFRGFSRILSRGAVVCGAVGVAVFGGGCTQVIAKKLPAPQNIVLEFSGEVCGAGANVGANSGGNLGKNSGANAGKNSGANSNLARKIAPKTSQAAQKPAAKKREIQVLNVRVLGAASRAVPVKTAAAVRDSEVVRLQEFLDISVQKSLIAALAKSCDLRPVLSTGADDSVKITIAEFFVQEGADGADGAAGADGAEGAAGADGAEGSVATTARLLAFVKTSGGERLLNLAFTARANGAQESQTAAVTGVFDELIAQVLATLRAKN